MMPVQTFTTTRIMILSLLLLLTCHARRGRPKASGSSGGSGSGLAFCSVNPPNFDTGAARDFIISGGSTIITGIASVMDPSGVFGTVVGVGMQALQADVGTFKFDPVANALTCLSDAVEQLMIDLAILEERVDELEELMCDTHEVGQEHSWMDVKDGIEAIQALINPTSTSNVCGMKQDGSGWMRENPQARKGEICTQFFFKQFIVMRLNEVLTDAIQKIDFLNLRVRSCAGHLECSPFPLRSSYWNGGQTLTECCRRPRMEWAWNECQPTSSSGGISYCTNKWHGLYFESFYTPLATVVEVVKDLWMEVMTVGKLRDNLNITDALKSIGVEEKLQNVITRVEYFKRLSYNLGIWNDPNPTGKTSCTDCSTCSGNCQDKSDCDKDAIPGDTSTFRFTNSRLHYQYADPWYARRGQGLRPVSSHPDAQADGFKTCMSNRRDGRRMSSATPRNAPGGTAHCVAPLKPARDMIDSNLDRMITTLTTALGAADPRAKCEPFSQMACLQAAARLGLQPGGPDYNFAGNYSVKGCYAYNENSVRSGQVCYGTGGSHDDHQTTSLGSARYRPDGFDCNCSEDDGWSDFSSCDAHCGEGTKTRTYTGSGCGTDGMLERESCDTGVVCRPCTSNLPWIRAQESQDCKLICSLDERCVAWATRSSLCWNLYQSEQDRDDSKVEHGWESKRNSVYSTGNHALNVGAGGTPCLPRAAEIEFSMECRMANVEMPQIDFSRPFILTVDVNIEALKNDYGQNKLFVWRNHNQGSKPNTQFAIQVDARPTTRNYPMFIIFAAAEDGEVYWWTHNRKPRDTLLLERDYKFKFHWSGVTFSISVDDNVVKSWTGVSVGFGKDFTFQNDACSLFIGSLDFHVEYSHAGANKCVCKASWGDSAYDSRCVNQQGCTDCAGNGAWCPAVDADCDEVVRNALTHESEGWFHCDPATDVVGVQLSWVWADPGVYGGARCDAIGAAEWISTVTDCEQAATDLTFCDTTAIQEVSTTNPRGCWFGAGGGCTHGSYSGSLYFNSGTGGASTRGRTSICRGIEAVPVDCVVDWSNSGSCSASCGDGTQTQTATVHTAAANGGTPCPADLTRRIPCNLRSCPPVRTTTTTTRRPPQPCDKLRQSSCSNRADCFWDASDWRNKKCIQCTKKCSSHRAINTVCCAGHQRCDEFLNSMRKREMRCAARTFAELKANAFSALDAKRLVQNNVVQGLAVVGVLTLVITIYRHAFTKKQYTEIEDPEI